MSQSHHTCTNPVYDLINPVILRAVYLIESLNCDGFSDRVKTILDDLKLELKRDNPSACRIFNYTESLSDSFGFAPKNHKDKTAKIIKYLISSLTSLAVALFHLKHHSETSNRLEYIQNWTSQSQKQMKEIEALI